MASPFEDFLDGQVRELQEDAVTFERAWGEEQKDRQDFLRAFRGCVQNAILPVFRAVKTRDYLSPVLRDMPNDATVELELTIKRVLCGLRYSADYKAKLVIEEQQIDPAPYREIGRLALAEMTEDRIQEAVKALFPLAGAK